MLVSAEIRWFWKGSAPAGLHDWFVGDGAHPCPVGGGVTARTDRYVRDAKQSELGIKARGGGSGFEVKGLVSTLAPLEEAPFTGVIELWSKWATDALTFEEEALVPVTKLRWTRKLVPVGGSLSTGSERREIPLGPDEKPHDGAPVKRGCNAELTRIGIEGTTWWSFGLEAFGKVSTVEDDLRMAAIVLARREPPAIHLGILASYPAWLRERLRT
jgi:hypothetical protein